MNCQSITLFTTTQASLVKRVYKVKTGNRITYSLNFTQGLNTLWPEMSVGVDPCNCPEILIFFKLKMASRLYVGVREKNQINNYRI